ncbi:hypothetical protein GCM10010910_02840 [Microbacterium nanhaiense]|uniref:DUF3515 domain-containing protein n=1 Tax=Microbacterium nanhaiense TaxID=1301026 RepID=A0ABQ2MX84_9MICO|nr:DUF3515 family protein [Microbacterium nanhaiense]GGO59568.1 hypothetical protein GCM10010910_02840 [Microbacterium nanhaiense]
MKSRVSALLALVVAAAALTACTPTVHMEPAAEANDPLCAEVSVRLPERIGDLDRVWTDAQATAAWGDPSAVLFRCGLESPAASTLQCVSFGGVDWLVDDEDYPSLRMTTFGRTPAAQAYVDTSKISGDQALEALKLAVGTLPVTGQCTTVTEATGDGEDAPETATE